MEVGGRHRWGGLWEAPVDYTLSGSHSNQTEGVRRYETFDDWGPANKTTPRDIVPWVNRRDGVLYDAPLLTTACTDQETWWGTLVTADSSYGVSPWIADERERLREGARLYWIRED